MYFPDCSVRKGTQREYGIPTELKRLILEFKEGSMAEISKTGNQRGGKEFLASDMSVKALSSLLVSTKARVRPVRFQEARQRMTKKL